MEEAPVVPELVSPKKKNIVVRLYDWVFSTIRWLYDWVLSWADTKYGTPALFTVAFFESSVFPIPPDALQIPLSAAKPRRAFWYATVSTVGSVAGAFLGFLIGYAFWHVSQDFFYNYVFSREAFAVVAGDEVAGIKVYRSETPEEVRQIEIVCCPSTKARLRNAGFVWTQEDGDAEPSERWRGVKSFDPVEQMRGYTFQFRRTDEANTVDAVHFRDQDGNVLDSFVLETTLGLYHEHAFWAILISAPTPVPYKVFTIAAGVCEICLWVLLVASIFGRGARFYAVAVVMYFYGPTVTRWIDKYFNLMMVLFAIIVIIGLVALVYLKPIVSAFLV